MDTIKFANGAVYDCPFLSTGQFNGTRNANITLANVSFPEAAQIFSDENMTTVMEWGDRRLIGYTQLVNLGEHSDGIQAMLIGGHDERIG